MMIGAIVASHPIDARAASQRYDYRIVHPLYGDIGTYTNIVDRRGNETAVESRLEVAVKLLGVVVFRETAARSEHWRGGRLVAYHGVTEINGKPITVSGEARGGGFVITTPAGTVTAPADVHPSNPWSAAILNTDTMMSTRDGRLYKVRISGGGVDPAAFRGGPGNLRRYEIDSDTRQFVWLDSHDVPVAFRTEEDGAAIDFLLVRYPTGAALDWPAPHPMTDPQEALAASTLGGR